MTYFGLKVSPAYNWVDETKLDFCWMSGVVQHLSICCSPNYTHFAMKRMLRFANLAHGLMNGGRIEDDLNRHLSNKEQRLLVDL